MTDRGPAAGPRRNGVIVDVSRAAAEKLGIVQHGRARVALEVLSPSEHKPSDAVQVAASLPAPVVDTLVLRLDLNITIDTSAVARLDSATSAPPAAAGEAAFGVVEVVKPDGQALLGPAELPRLHATRDLPVAEPVQALLPELAIPVQPVGRPLHRLRLQSAGPPLRRPPARDRGERWLSHIAARADVPYRKRVRMQHNVDDGLEIAKEPHTGRT